NAQEQQVTHWMSWIRIGSGGVLAMALAGCSPDAAPDDAPGARPAADSTTAPDASGTPAGAIGPTSCGAIALVEGTRISGQGLADCMVEYLAFAGSGASEMRSETASSRMAWRMGEDYEAYAELDSGVRITTTGGAAWVDFGDTGWVKADPSVPG